MLKRASLLRVVPFVVLAPALCSGGDNFRTSVSQKGSLLLFPSVEIQWRPDGNVSIDTFIHIANDYPEDVEVQLYFVNGDPPRDAVYAGDPPQVIVAAEPGWNFVDCQFKLTGNQTTSWSAVNGMAGGCQPFTILDDDGRPDGERSPGFRMLRGYVMAWAVDSAGEEISWNHLSGYALSVDYHEIGASEYGAYAFQALRSERGAPSGGDPGMLLLDGQEYDAVPDTLLWSFEAAGVSRIIEGLGGTLSSNTELTLMPVVADFRNNGLALATTTARYDIWNENERRFSGTQHDITCWHQSLISRYPAPNHLILSNLQTNHGKARIRGVAGGGPGSPNVAMPLLGVAQRFSMFGVVCAGFGLSSKTLIGMGFESGTIAYDPIGAGGDELQADSGVLDRLEIGERAGRAGSATRRDE